MECKNILKNIIEKFRWSTRRCASALGGHAHTWTQLEDFRSSDPFYMSTPCPISKNATATYIICIWIYVISVMQQYTNCLYCCDVIFNLIVELTFRDNHENSWYSKRQRIAVVIKTVDITYSQMKQ